MPEHPFQLLFPKSEQFLLEVKTDLSKSKRGHAQNSSETPAAGLLFRNYQGCHSPQFDCAEVHVRKPSFSYVERRTFARGRLFHTESRQLTHLAGQTALEQQQVLRPGI